MAELALNDDLGLTNAILKALGEPEIGVTDEGPPTYTPEALSRAPGPLGDNYRRLAAEQRAREQAALQAEEQARAEQQAADDAEAAQTAAEQRAADDRAARTARQNSKPSNKLKAGIIAALNNTTGETK